ncbi:type III secretion protein V [Paraburkholderia sp. BL8N3]|nr:type III secretion system export apparatus subunit SctV [Paraburkholderia sp. BL8N3]TCK32008.1 type III secretion protein V [Paraburkholderia sp. BL8N3]
MKRISGWLNFSGGRQEMLLAVMLMLAVFMMILPLPTFLVDVLIAINIALSILLLLTSISVSEPLEFSVFPSLLLILALYRLALTVSTSKLILLQHDAGDIVSAFGNFVVGGNLAVGITVFGIVTIVQFIVITKGAERVAEVGARFSLDGMPGKQMSIDGDMRAGAIDAVEAKRLRSLVQKESQLYGAMDGAMKFVKGDAIAGIIVILVNIIGGMLMGVFQNGMDASEAVSVYSVLSIGDGLIAQIPALIVSIAAGIMATRVPGEERHHLAHELGSQIMRRPQMLMVIAGMLVVFALIPGFPMVVFLPLAAATAGLAILAVRPAKRAGADGAKAAGGSEVQASVTPGADALTVKFAPGSIDEKVLADGLEHLRWSTFDKLGVAVPPMRLKADPSMSAENIQVCLYDEPVLTQRVPGKLILLAKQGMDAPAAAQVDRLPFGGFVLNWLEPGAADGLAAIGAPLARDEERIVYCVSLVIDRFAEEFIGVQEARHLMDAMEERYPELVKELQRQLQINKVAEVLQRIVAERISIRDLRTVFQALIKWAPKEKEAVMLCEYVRVALRRQIIGRHRSVQGNIGVWLVGETIENMIRSSIRQTAAGSYSTLAQPQIDAVLASIQTARAGREDAAALLTEIDVRRFLRKFIERDMFHIPVLSYQELGDDANLKVLGNIDLDEEFSDANA